MVNLTHPSIVLSSIAARSKLLLLPLLIFFVTLASVLVTDANARTRDRTLGGTTTDMHDHGIRVRCTWPDLEGAWTSDSGLPLSVTHSVDKNDLGEYATCSGWNVDADGIADVLYLDDGFGGDGVVDHFNAPHGSGQFLFNISYTSSSTTTCVEDPDSGIGNNCVKFTDVNNRKHGGGGSDPAPTSGATIACANNDPIGSGTTLTYQFYCADGVDVEGQLTLVPSLDNGVTIQVAPNFTGPCGQDRVAASDCTHMYGGVPTKIVKKKGVSYEVVDTNACLEAFPEASINNALNSGQVQVLTANALLFYQETAYTGSCDTITDLPTEQGSATAAFGRYCTSDIETFDDNLPGNVYNGDPVGLSNHGFDNELRVCEETNNNGPHTGSQDVESVELTNILVAGSPSTLNLNCASGGNTDSGGFNVLVSDQAQLLAINVVVDPLSDAPKLEGISPIDAVINTDDLGAKTLVLTYASCPDLSATVIANNNLDFSLNNTNVVLNLTGTMNLEDTSLDQTINAVFEVKVNGL